MADLPKSKDEPCWKLNRRTTGKFLKMTSSGAIGTGLSSFDPPSGAPEQETKQLVDDFRRPDSAYHGDTWETLTPGHWHIRNNALRRDIPHSPDPPYGMLWHGWEPVGPSGRKTVLGGLDWGKRMYTCNRRRAIKLIPARPSRGVFTQTRKGGREKESRFRCASRFRVAQLFGGGFNLWLTYQKAKTN